MTVSQNWENIPSDLRYTSQWCISGPDKSPYRTDGKLASVTQPADWTDWYSAQTIARQWGTAGIGFVLTEDDEFTCIDLDVKDADNEPDPSKHTTPEQRERYQRIIDSFDSYTELSKSGKGVHIWIRGSIGAGCRRDGVEVYSQQRFIICTGNTIRHKPIEHRQELLDMLVSEIRAAQESSHVPLIELDEQETDDVIWSRAVNASNGDKFVALCKGDWKGQGYPSQSEADLSLLSMLTFYSKSNEQVRRMFRATELGKRDKAVRNNKYLDRTLSMIRARQEREDAAFQQQQAHSIALVQALAPKPKLIVETPSQMEWPPGAVGHIAQWLYSIAPRPVREVAIVSALGFFAGICGRAYSISGSGLNLYIVLVARSAIGKEAMHSGISKLAHTIMNVDGSISDFLDFADYASGPALIKSLAMRSSFVNIAGEWGRKLRKMGEDHVEGPMASLRTVMTNLYQKSSAGTIVGGIGYSDKEKDVKSTNGVAYSMIGETTPDTFYESLTNTMMQDGFMSRFIVIEYNGLRPEFNHAQGNALDENTVIYLANLAADVRMREGDPGSQDVAMTREVQELMHAFDKECDKQINSTDDESWRQMWNRAHLKALKVSALLAVADNPKTPCVKLEHAQWALDLIRRDIRILSRRISEGDVGDGDMVRERKMLACLREYVTNDVPPGYKLPEAMRLAGVVPRKYLMQRLCRTNSFAKYKNGQNMALDSTIRSLVDSGYLVELGKDKHPPEWNFTGKCYRVMALPETA